LFKKLEQDLLKNFFGFFQRLPGKCKKIFPPEKKKQFFNIPKLSKKARSLTLLALLIFLGILALNFYFKKTEVQPSFGGTLREGVIGQPRFINPLYLSDNDVDRDLVELLFRGLMKYNENGEVVKDMADDLEIKEEGQVYEIKLKENISWHDGEPLTAEDVVFTINLLQNPEYKSSQAIKWSGVSIEKLSDRIVQFRLKKAYSGFLETLTEKIIPKHIFKDMPPKNLPWALSSEEHLEEYLVGSGPFQFKQLVQDNKSGYIESLTLVRNQNYFVKKPLISQISFHFFTNKEDLLKSGFQGRIDGLLISDPSDLETFSEETFNSFELSLPRYFAVFFNQNPPEDKPKLLISKEVREALNYAVDKEEILEKTVLGKGKIVDSPILPDFYGFEPPSKIYQFDKEKAEKILEEAGFKYIDDGSEVRKKIISQKPTFSFTKTLQYGSKGDEVTQLQKCLADPAVGGPEIYPSGKITGYFGNETKQAVILFQERYKDDILASSGLEKGTGQVKSKTREKLNQLCFPQKEEVLPLQFSLVTVNKPLMIKISQLLQKSWKEIGANVEIKFEAISTIETDIIKPRNFEALLFGEVLNSLPDPFPFWHSSQKESPGLNLISYENKKTDKLLEEARATLDNSLRKEKLEEFQDLLIEDAPCLFLLRPDLVYFTSKKVKGQTVEKIIEPSKRFVGIENWYLKTRRVWIWK